MDPSTMSVRELLAELQQAGVSADGCVEKEDIIARVLKARSGGGASSSSAKPEPAAPPAAAPAAAPSSRRSGGGSTDMAAEVRRIHACKDLYGVLKLDRETATESAIRSAYKRLALQLHPDKCKLAGSEDAFKKVSRAYETLSDAGKRQRYDLGGEDAVSQDARHTDTDEIFRAFFGGGDPFAGADIFGGGMGGMPHVRTFTFGGGGPGMFFHEVNTGGRRRRQQQQQRRDDADDAPPMRLPAALTAALNVIPPAMLPLLGLFIVPLLLLIVNGVLQIVLAQPFLLIMLLMAPPSARKMLVPVFLASAFLTAGR
eukprot:TRINITY_DN2047_c0_g2_i1.p1 TRINITY_DN2047_c0_g2~~TRINITY_DN2047_c0_g2_i1.p1  ORF type:complete len:314 (+),score=89.09 TRINITY_DN2047_c0_g2_i1:112-1053(+)